MLNARHPGFPAGSLQWQTEAPMAVKLAPPTVSLQPLGERRVLVPCLEPPFQLCLSSLQMSPPPGSHPCLLCLPSRQWPLFSLFVFSHMLDFGFLKDRAILSGQWQASFFFDDLKLRVDVFLSVGSSNLKAGSHSFFKYCFSVLPPVYTIKPSRSSHHVSYWLFSHFFHVLLSQSYSHRGRSVSHHCFTNSNPFWLHLICSAH